MDTYKLLLALLGLVLLGAAWIPHVVERHPLTFPIIHVAAGALLYALPLPLPPADPVAHPVAAERITELAVLIALIGAGLRIDTRFGWRRWRLTWRLLGVAMPLCVLAGAWLGLAWLGWGVAASVLLGAVMAPTDPVLASDVQVARAGEGKEDPVRFALTSEAGLNDGLAFPFVWLAIALALATAAAPMDWGRWLALDVGWRVAGGVGIGAALGYGMMHFVFRSAHRHTLTETGEGLVALAITLITYGVAELCKAYGFLAVFVAALVVRQFERGHAYHATLNLFAEQCERLLAAILLVLLGGAAASGLLAGLRWQEVAFAVAFVALVRPLSGWLSLLGSGLPARERWAIAVFGVRGVGSLYYVAFALNHAPFGDARPLWRVVGAIVLLSILVHGLSAKPVLAWLDRRAGRPTA